MPLIFSPLSEQVLDALPSALRPKSAFIMRQLGQPPLIDQAMNLVVRERLVARGFAAIDADGSVGGKDYLARILGLIRGTGFTVAIFSHETRGTAMANIALELGFAAMCGKPLVIVKAPKAVAPSDLKRTDWIDYDPENVAEFDRKFGQAIDDIVSLGEFEATLLTTSLDARTPDCAVALERAMKGFLLTGGNEFIEAADLIRQKIDAVDENGQIADLERLRGEVKVFVQLARRALAMLNHAA